MATSNLRRRLHHGDVNRSNEDDVNEPLLARYDSDDDNRSKPSNYENEEQQHWSFLFSNLIAQWAQWLANILSGSGSMLGKLFPLSLSQGSIDISPLQEERLSNLRERLQLPFDGSRVDHQDALRQLWRLSYPNTTIPPLKSESWKQMGWQGPDPSTDFRGGGYISLENLIYFAQHYPDSFENLLNKKEGKRAEWEYPFAVAGINISFMLIQMLDLKSGFPASKPGIQFLDLLARDENAFDELYCVAFRLMDAQWLVKKASYMEFNEVLKSTRTQLERELALEDVNSVKDLPSYTMLYR